MTNDLSQGSLIKNIGIFSLPYLFSYFLQTLYGLADLFIVGQYNGAVSISAVSIGSQITHMLTVMLVGLAMGSTVMIGRYVGAKDEIRKQKTIGNTITLFIGVALILTIVLYASTKSILSLISTPAESMNQAIDYLHICFLGIPFIVAYNIISSIFRGIGDSKTPMYFIAISCGVNIVLDYVFIGGFDMKAAGAAYGTIIAQAVSVLIAFISIRKKKWVTITRSDLKWDASIMKDILKIGIPVSCQDGFIQVSFLVITMIANQRGVEVAAAVGIVEKIISFVFLVPSTMLSTVSTIAAQNMGAHEYKRAQQTLWLCIGVAAAIGMGIAILTQFFSYSMVGLFTNDIVVIEYGSQYIKTYIFDCVLAAIHFSFSGYFAACQVSIISFIHNALSILLVRIPGAYLASQLFPDTLTPMGLAAPAGSLLSAIICVIAYQWLQKKMTVSS